MLQYQLFNFQNKGRIISYGKLRTISSVMCLPHPLLEASRILCILISRGLFNFKLLHAVNFLHAGAHHCHFQIFHCLSKELTLQVLRLTNSHQLL